MQDQSKTTNPQEKQLREKETKKVETIDQKQKRINECSKQINKILDDYGCTFYSYFVITDRGNFPKLKVISK